MSIGGSNERSVHLFMASTSGDDYFYEDHLGDLGELVQIATRDFKISLEVAERMANDIVTLAILRGVKISDPHRWLVGTMTRAAQRYNEINRVAEQLGQRVAIGGRHQL